jgi:hypothetical protein
MRNPLSSEHSSRWVWPMDLTHYDRTPELTEAERGLILEKSEAACLDSRVIL